MQVTTVGITTPTIIPQDTTHIIYTHIMTSMMSLLFAGSNAGTGQLSPYNR
jgi:hypothetical protein